MLSILIPVYNYDIRGLVSDLISQIELIQQPVEIILLNDGSDKPYLVILEKVDLSSYIQLHHFDLNQGRVASRKKLAELANYDYLLFMDCDAGIVSKGYITNYLNELNNSSVIVGGHVYQNETPESAYRLHWKYGRKVEVRSLGQRHSQPYQSFSTFNFCIRKDLFIQFLNDIKVEGYGHEDTLIGHILNQNNIMVRHIDNPLMHKGLKFTDQFLSDSNAALENAVALSRVYPNIDIKVIQYAKAITKVGLSGLLLSLLNVFHKRIESNLRSGNPNTNYLQLYKLRKVLKMIKGS